MENKSKPCACRRKETDCLAGGVLHLIGCDVDVAHSEILYSVDTFDDSILKNDFVVKSGNWYVEDGWLVGKNPINGPGIVLSRANYYGDVMLEVKAQLVPPCTHDIDISIHTEWDEVKNHRGNAYVAGLEGWWHGRVGFEKSPEYKLYTLSSLFPFDPTAVHHFAMGNVGGKVFVIADGKLCFEVSDPDPLDVNANGKIGFEAYSSWWRLRDLRVRALRTEAVSEGYAPEF